MPTDKEGKKEQGGETEGFPFEVETTDLAGRTVRGVAVTTVAQVATAALRIVSTVVLARLLLPEDFGLIAMVAPLIEVGQLLNDMGLGLATIQHDKLSHAQASTLFWINAAVGVALAGCAVALAPGVAWFYGDPRLLLVTVALSPAFVLRGLTIQHNALIRRRLRFVSLAVVTILPLIAGVGVAITGAALGLGVWALVLQSLSAHIVTLVAVWSAAGFMPGRPVRGSGVRKMLKLGGHLAAFNVVNYGSRRLDVVLVGKLAGSATLGIYSKAQQLLLLPVVQICGAVSGASLPALARLQNQPQRFRKFYQGAVGAMTATAMPLVFFCFVMSEEIVVTVLGENWREAAVLMRWLAPSALLTTFNPALGLVYSALGRTDRQLRWSAVSATVRVVAFAIGSQWGAIGIAAALSAADVTVRLPAVMYCFHGTPLRLRDLGAVLWRPILASTTASLAVIAAAEMGVSASTDPGALLVGMAVFGLSYMATWALLPGGVQTVREAMAQLRQRGNRVPPGR